MWSHDIRRSVLHEQEHLGFLIVFIGDMIQDNKRCARESLPSSLELNGT
jgi:hypothetical protein